jgi:hypothetical protein
MFNIILDVRSLSTVVRLYSFPRLLVETLASQISALSIIKALIKIVILTRPADSMRGRQFIDYSARVTNLSWLKYGSDGNRIQLHDNVNSVIGKLPKNFSLEQFELELKARQRVGSLTPKIMESCSLDGFVLEAKLSLRCHVDLDNVFYDLFTSLRKRLGVSRAFTTADYLSKYADVYFYPLVCKLARQNNVKNVSVSLCHGDAWSGNIFQTPSSEIIIIDWEYCGYRIESHDVWFYVFSKWASTKQACDRHFYSELESKLSKVYPSTFELNRIKVVHMLHLFERYATQLSCYGKASTSPEMQFLETEIISITQELS